MALNRIACTREATQALERGEIGFDEMTPLYRHAMIHAGAIIPKDRGRFRHCPTCEQPLPVLADE